MLKDSGIIQSMFALPYFGWKEITVQVLLRKYNNNNYSSLIRDTFPPSSAIFTCIFYFRNISFITRTMCQAIIPPNTNLSIGNASNLLLRYFTHPLLKRMKAFELTDIRLLAWPNIYTSIYTCIQAQACHIPISPQGEAWSVSLRGCQCLLTDSL